MDTLVELGEFVGLGDATPARPDGGETNRNPITMRAAANNLATVLSGSDRNSLRAMMQALPNLTPVSLEAERVSGISEETAFAPIIRVHPSGGEILWTSLCAFRAERPKTGGDFQPIEGAIAEKTLDNVELDSVGLLTLSDEIVYIFKVTRAGIPSTGITVLEKDFLFRADPKPLPPQPPPPPLVHPLISVISSGGGTFTVNGSGFLPSATVHIRVVDPVHQNDQNFNTISDASGKVMGFKTHNICVHCGTIFFSANDDRKDPDDHPLGILFSNTVPMTCPG
jgi:hypothetical protein